MLDKNHNILKATLAI